MEKELASVKVIIDGRAIERIKDIAGQLFHNDSRPERVDVLYRALHVYLQTQGVEPNFTVRTTTRRGE